MAKEKKRIEVCDSRLGEIMAHAPVGADGIFPFEPARDALDEINSEAMLSGFYTGCFNKRGVHSRGLFDGGNQERSLAAQYRADATALEISHSHLSSCLAKLAGSYDRDGLLEDLEVRLRRERH